MQHVLRCWERQSDGSEYKKTLRRPGLRPEPRRGNLQRSRKPPSWWGGACCPLPNNPIPALGPSVLASSTPHSKISSDAHGLCVQFPLLSVQVIFPSVLWHCWLGDRKGIWSVKKVGCWFWWRFDWSFACIKAPVITTTSIVLSFSKSRMDTFWYWLTQIDLEKWPLNRRERSYELLVASVGHPAVVGPLIQQKNSHDAHGHVWALGWGNSRL